MTNTINGQKLTFLISDDPVLSLMVTDEIVTDVQVESDFDADIILPKAKRTIMDQNATFNIYWLQKNPYRKYQTKLKKKDFLLLFTTI